MTDTTEQDRIAATRVMAAVEGTTDAYVRVTAGDLLALARLALGANYRTDPIARHAADVVAGHADGPDARMHVHRDRHLRELLEKLH